MFISSLKVAILRECIYVLLKKLVQVDITPLKHNIHHNKLYLF